MKNKTKFLSFCLTLGISLVMVAPFFAGAGTGDVTSGSKNLITNPMAVKSISDFITSLIDNVLFPVGGVVAILAVMWAGFLYVTARGNATQIKTAHEAIKWTVLGAAILFGAKILSAAIQSTITQLK